MDKPCWADTPGWTDGGLPKIGLQIFACVHAQIMPPRFHFPLLIADNTNINIGINNFGLQPNFSSDLCHFDLQVTENERK